jgi:hypothetical protein
VHVTVPVTLAAWSAGEYEISALAAGSEMLGVDPYTPVAWTVAVTSGVVRTSPCAPSPTRQRPLLQVAPFSATLLALIAFVGPLIGLPCWAHVVPPSEVTTVVPVLPSARQNAALTHPTPLSVCVVVLVCGDQEPPSSIDLITVPPAPAA